MIVIGQVIGFDKVRAPQSDWRAGGTKPVGATGFSPQTSLFNLQTRNAAPDGFLPQNIAARVPLGWATNPLQNARPSIHPGNGVSSRGQAV